MKLWLLTVGEPLPEDTQGEMRLFRTGQFAEWLAGRGHDVTFFTNTVDHAQRRQRYGQTTVLERSDRYRVVCLKSRLYTRTVSLARFLSHRDTASAFETWCRETQPPVPDVILASYPTEELCRAALEYGRDKGVPVAMDTRDLWPDLFADVVPAPLRPLARLALKPMDSRAARTLAGADALSGHTKGLLDWTLAKAGRARQPQDFVFPFTFAGKRMPPEEQAALAAARPADDKLRFAFFGTLSRRSSGLERIVDAFAGLSQADRARTELVIGGIGDARAGLEAQVAATGAPVVFRGWINRPEILELMALSDFGLLPYTKKDFHVSLPNKFSEYLSGGLPIFSCTEGAIRDFIATWHCGVWVEPDTQAITNRIAALIASGPDPAMRAAAARAYDENFQSDHVFQATLDKLEALSTHGRA